MRNRRYQYGALLLATVLLVSGCSFGRMLTCIGTLGNKGCGKSPNVAPPSPSPSPSPEAAK
jgi:hypothetical protein